MDTIYALATAQGKSGVAVVRLSGPSAHDAVRALAGDLPQARRASLRQLTDPDAGAIDSALVLVFNRGASFTGEDAAEFHIHGSRATIAATLRALGIRAVGFAHPIAIVSSRPRPCARSCCRAKRTTKPWGPSSASRRYARSARFVSQNSRARNRPSPVPSARVV